ncbi:MAG: hypothetical protein M1490_03820, partial [Candidatus Bathyarchaeota archaeon]|nr:hypothetical protein [Candidatus Bathyarchaeota archaeon]
MTAKSVRLTPNDENKESEIFAFYGVQGETYSEQYRDFLSKLHRAMRLNVVIETPDNPAMHPIENFTNLRCPMRKRVNVPHKDNKTGALLWTEEKIYCVDNPPRATQLLGMEVCEVCIAKFYGYGLAKKLRAANPDNIPTPKANSEREEPTPIREEQQITVTTPAPKPQPTAKTYTPIKNWIPIQRSDGAKVCPFGGAFVYALGECNIS